MTELDQIKQGEQGMRDPRGQFPKGRSGIAVSSPVARSMEPAIMHFDPAEIAYVPTTGVRRVHQTPLVAASDRTLDGYGCLVDAPESFAIEIVRWPAQGWRPIDENSG